jgi:hypothetical protein
VFRQRDAKLVQIIGKVSVVRKCRTYSSKIRSEEAEEGEQLKQKILPRKRKLREAERTRSPHRSSSTPPPLYLRGFYVQRTLPRIFINRCLMCPHPSSPLALSLSLTPSNIDTSSLAP